MVEDSEKRKTKDEGRKKKGEETQFIAACGGCREWFSVALRLGVFAVKIFI